MQAMLLPRYGEADAFTLGELPMPMPGPGEILLEIFASALNPFDLMLRRGDMAQFIPLALPAVLGSDAAGTVVRVGEGVTGIAPGDRVIADFPPNGQGAHAAFGVVPASAIAPLPASLSFVQGAVLPKAGLMGRQAVAALDVRQGEQVLVAGALGAVGRVAVQFLKELGAVPVAGVRAAQLQQAREWAGQALDLAMTPHIARFDAAISAAPDAASALFAHVRDGGRVASIVPVPPGGSREGRVNVHELYHRTDADTLVAVANAAALGRLVLPIARTFHLEQLVQAHRALAEGPRGKIVLIHSH